MLAYVGNDEFMMGDAKTLASMPEADALLRWLEMQRGFARIAKNIRADLKAHRPKKRPENKSSDNVVGLDGLPVEMQQTFDVPGLPPGTPLPPGYAITPAGLIRRTGMAADEVILISRLVIVPVALYQDMASGCFHVVVAWETGDPGKWARRVVSRGVVSEARRIVGLAEFGAPVDSGSAAEIVRWCTAVQQYCDLPISYASTSLGWQASGDLGFLWGSTCLGGSVHLLADDGTEQLADGFRQAGTFEGWKKAWDAIEPHPTVGLAVYAAIAPVIVGLIREAPTFAVDWSGRQQGGKTTLLQLAASVWGDPTVLILQWRGTAVGIERALAFNQHLPTILDDTKHANPPTIVTETIYQVTGRRGGLKGKVEGMRRTAVLRTVLLSTGERAATTFTQDAGARSRCLAVEGLPFGGTGQATSERVQITVMDNHGHLGPMVVQHLLSQRNEWSVLAERWKRLRTQISEKQTGADGRGSAYLATLMLAGLVVEEAAGLKLRESVMVEAERWAAAAAKSADRPLEALRWVWSWLDQHHRSVAKPREDLSEACLSDGRELIAIWPRDRPPGVIVPALARDMARDGYALADVQGEWIRRGWMEPERRKMSANGSRIWVHAFTPAAVAAVDGEA